MFKKIRNIKEHQIIKKIKELLQVPRYRSLVILGLWMIFFAFVFFLLNHSSKPPTKYSAFDSWKNNIHYGYQMNVQVDKSTYLIEGSRNGENETFTLLEQSYYLEYGSLYVLENGQKKIQNNTVLFCVDFEKLKPSFLVPLLLEENLEYTTKYESGMIKKGYIVSATSFVENSYESILIEVVQKEGEIIEWNLDLTNIQNSENQCADKIQTIYTSIDIQQ